MGQESPLYAGASAKVLLAYFSPKQLERYVKRIELEKIADNTITLKETLVNELNSIRNQGYAFSNGERVKGAVSISAPIFNPFNEILAGMSIIIPSARFEEYNSEELIELLKNGTSEITNKLKTFN
ncbi:DNA-binding IclR family transcriptional regulator [Neobacillus niacini]|uniref:IclR family transcriptional regulator n=1 Tax=Neobacillus niacini TaxID=86668 RepID=UPI0027885E81|nr:IclR family transcriptional regulator C-terminal domain-containing protein [Neobacillus niacini]MDQ1002150.1 DNA-binding IclR family transcriptional regulator [Neobacillus niacini]